MKDAMARFNSWQCPECHKFTSKPNDSDIGKCGRCGEPLFFPTKEKMPEKKEEEWKDKAKKLLTPEVVNEKPNLPLIPTSSIVIHAAGADFITNNYFSSDGLEGSFVKNPKLLAWLKKFATNNGFSLSEVVVGFAAKGARQYLKEKKA